MGLLESRLPWDRRLKHFKHNRRVFKTSLIFAYFQLIKSQDFFYQQNTNVTICFPMQVGSKLKIFCLDMFIISREYLELSMAMKMFSRMNEWDTLRLILDFITSFSPKCLTRGQSQLKSNSIFIEEFYEIEFTINLFFIKHTWVWSGDLHISADFVSHVQVKYLKLIDNLSSSIDYSRNFVTSFFKTQTRVW